VVGLGRVKSVETVLRHLRAGDLANCVDTEFLPKRPPQEPMINETGIAAQPWNDLSSIAS
jgi:hypothetical protein